MAKQKRPQYGKQAPAKGSTNGSAKGASARIWWVAGGVVVAVALVIGLSVGLNRPTETALVPPVATESADRKAMGPVTAPVTLIEYGDFL